MGGEGIGANEVLKASHKLKRRAYLFMAGALVRRWTAEELKKRKKRGSLHAAFYRMHGLGSSGYLAKIATHVRGSLLRTRASPTPGPRARAAPRRRRCAP